MAARLVIPVRQYPSTWTLGSGIVQTASLRRDLRQSLRTRQPVAGLRQRMAVAPAVVTPTPDRLLFVCANRVVTTPAPAGSDDAHNAPANKDL